MRMEPISQKVYSTKKDSTGFFQQPHTRTELSLAVITPCSTLALAIDIQEQLNRSLIALREAFCSDWLILWVHTTY